MASSSPNWVIFLLGGGGLLSLATYLTKNVVDQKEAQIQRLTQENRELENKIQEERDKAKRLVDIFAEQLKNLDTGRLGPEDAVRLREIFNLLDKLKSDNLQEEFDNCKHAAEWLEICKKDWVQQACEHANRKYQNLLPKGKIRLFKEDISSYLDWVHTCLFKDGHTLNTPLSDFVRTPAIESHHPYIAAITYLIEQGNFGELTSEQRAYLREVLIRLTEEIRDST